MAGEKSDKKQIQIKQSYNILAVMRATNKHTHDQLVELDKETMVSIILSMQQQLAEQALLIQELRDYWPNTAATLANHPAAMV